PCAGRPRRPRPPGPGRAAGRPRPRTIPTTSRPGAGTASRCRRSWAPPAISPAPAPGTTGWTASTPAWPFARTWPRRVGSSRRCGPTSIPWAIPSVPGADRAPTVTAVVGPGRGIGEDGRRRRARGGHRDPPDEPGTALVRLGRRHARLVHLASAVVGPPDPHLVRARRRGRVRGPGRRGAGGVHPGHRRARHLVLLRAVAVLHDGLARPHRGPRALLPDVGPGH